MSPSVQGMYADDRKCPFCGKPAPGRLSHCPFCREAIPEVKVGSRYSDLEGRKKIRRGLLYMLMAGIIYYFAGGYSSWQSPIPIPGFVNQYFTPLLFLGGMGLTLYGLFVKMRS